MAHNLARWTARIGLASRWRIASNRMPPKIRDAILCLNGMGGSALTANSADCRDLICIHSGSPKSHYVNRVADALLKATGDSIGVSAASCDETLSGIWCRFHMCRPIALKAASSK